jgi:hypothetical protein
VGRERIALSGQNPIGISGLWAEGSDSNRIPDYGTPGRKEGITKLSGSYFDVDGLSSYIHRSTGAVRNLVLRRAIPFRKPAGRLLFDKDEIDQWIEKSPGISLKEMNSESER